MRSKARVLGAALCLIAVLFAAIAPLAADPAVAILIGVAVFPPPVVAADRPHGDSVSPPAAPLFARVPARAPPLG